MNIDINDKIKIFESNNMELFNILKEVLDNIENGGKLIPFVVFQYFESIARFQGDLIDLEDKFKDFDKYRKLINGDKKKLFFKGFFDTFPEIIRWGDDLKYSTINTIWKSGRNGIYHSGILEKNIRLFNDMNEPIRSHKGINGHPIRNDPIIDINPFMFTFRIVSHFKEYIETLRNPSNQNDNIRDVFENRFDELYSDHIILKTENGYNIRLKIVIPK